MGSFKLGAIIGVSHYDTHGSGDWDSQIGEDQNYRTVQGIQRDPHLLKTFIILEASPIKIKL